MFPLITSSLWRCARILCLLFCLLFAALAVRSYRGGDFFGYDRNVVVGQEVIHDRYGLGTGSGIVMVTASRSTLAWPRVFMRPDGSVTDFPLGRHFEWTRQRPDGLPDMGWQRSFLGRRGFAWWSRDRGGTYQHQAAVPFWVPVLLFGLGPFTWWAMRIARRVRVTRRLRANLCIACGYDLRGGEREGGTRCPECGRSQSLATGGLMALRLAAAASGVALVGGVWSVFALAPWDDPGRRGVVALNASQTRPATSPSASGPAAAARSAPDRAGLRRGAEFWRVTHEQLRQAATQLDWSRTYVFLYVSNPVNANRERHVPIHLFARVDGQWRVELVHRGPGEVVGGSLIPYPLRIGEIRLDDDKDLVVTFVDSNGRVVETHSAFDDRADTTNKLLQRFSMQSNSELEREFFPSK